MTPALHTYYAVPVAHGEGLKATVGEGIGVFTNALYHVGLALAGKCGDVIAVWKFHEGTDTSSSIGTAKLVQPTTLMVVVSDDYGMLELASHYATDVEITVAPDLA